MNEAVEYLANRGYSEDFDLYGIWNDDGTRNVVPLTVEQVQKYIDEYTDEDEGSLFDPDLTNPQDIANHFDIGFDMGMAMGLLKAGK